MAYANYTCVRFYAIYKNVHIQNVTLEELLSMQSAATKTQCMHSIVRAWGRAAQLGAIYQ